jgi:hypothetical protein
MTTMANKARAAGKIKTELIELQVTLDLILYGNTPQQKKAIDKLKKKWIDNYHYKLVIGTIEDLDVLCDGLPGNP